MRSPRHDLDDRYLLVRAASLYIAVMLTGAVWVWRRPTASCGGRRRARVLLEPAGRAGAAPGGGAVRLVAVRRAAAACCSACPWICISRGRGCGARVLALAFPSLPLGAVLVVALAADLVLMPAATPVVRLGPAWLIGEIVGLLAGLLPGQLLARWTSRDERLAERAVLQVLAFTGLVLFVLPAIAIEGSGSAWRESAGSSTLASQPDRAGARGARAARTERRSGIRHARRRHAGAVRSAAAARDDRRLCVRPQSDAALRRRAAAPVLGLVLQNVWVSAAGVMAHLYSVGLAGWDEDEDLRRRFGEDWIAYRRGVRAWVPRLRPWHRTDRPPRDSSSPRAAACAARSGDGSSGAEPGSSSIMPAETHPSGALKRITYEPGDGSRAASGVEAVARALEHIHLGWALLGWRCVCRSSVSSRSS